MSTSSTSCLTPPSASTVTQGNAVCWGTDEMPTLFSGVLEPEFSPAEELENTLKLRDGDGIYQSYIFNNFLKNGDYTLVARTGTEIPAPGSLITDANDGRKYIVLSRPPSFVANNVRRVSITIEGSRR